MIKKGCRTRTKDDSDVQIIRQELKKKKKKKNILVDLGEMEYNMGEKMKERYKLYKKEPGEMIDMKTK